MRLPKVKFLCPLDQTAGNGNIANNTEHKQTITSGLVPYFPIGFFDDDIIIGKRHFIAFPRKEKHNLFF